jgi:putative serine protease PepD
VPGYDETQVQETKHMAPSPVGTGEGGTGDEKPPKKGSGRVVLASVLGGVIGAVAIVAILFGFGLVKTGPKTSTSGTSPAQNITINADTEDATVAEAVAAKTVPSVASVYVTTSSSSSLGSGVILDTDGNILTNYHVIDGAEEISVTIEGQSYTATVVGSDESSDLAVIKADLEGATVTPIEVGDSSSLVMGQWVMAIGSPYGLEQSVSTGIVSALYRSTMMQSTSGNTIYTNLIQTDAAINPGQLRRRSCRLRGQACRHQHPDRVRVRLISRHRLRHSFELRYRGREYDYLWQAGRAPLYRPHDADGHLVSCPALWPRCLERRLRRRSHVGQPC